MKVIDFEQFYFWVFPYFLCCIFYINFRFNHYLPNYFSEKDVLISQLNKVK